MLKARANGLWVSTDRDDQNLMANREKAKDWEKYQMAWQDDGTVAFLARRGENHDKKKLKKNVWKIRQNIFSCQEWTNLGKNDLGNLRKRKRKQPKKTFLARKIKNFG